MFDSIKLTALDKKEILSQLDYMDEFICNEVDDWYPKSELHDMVEQLVITLKQKGILDRLDE